MGHGLVPLVMGFCAVASIASVVLRCSLMCSHDNVSFVLEFPC